MELTENTVAEIATDDLLEAAETIRDAVKAKSVTAEQVGTLFVELIEACGNIRDALALFLDTNVTEITDSIEEQLSDATDATTSANAAAQKATAAASLVEQLVETLSSQNLSKPTKIVAVHPGDITVTNTTTRKITAYTLPKFGIGSVLFIGNGEALELTPDGYITPLEVGTYVVTAVSTADTSLYKKLTIAVVNPRIRLTNDGYMRLDSDGNIRLT